MVEARGAAGRQAGLTDVIVLKGTASGVRLPSRNIDTFSGMRWHLPEQRKQDLERTENGPMTVSTRSSWRIWSDAAKWAPDHFVKGGEGPDRGT